MSQAVHVLLIPCDPLILNAADWTAIGTIAVALGTFVLARVTVKTGAADGRHDGERVLLAVMTGAVAGTGMRARENTGRQGSSSLSRTSCLARFALKELHVACLTHFDRKGPVVSLGTDDGDAGKLPKNQDLSKMISILTCVLAS